MSTASTSGTRSALPGTDQDHGVGPIRRASVVTFRSILAITPFRVVPVIERKHDGPCPSAGYRTIFDEHLERTSIDFDGAAVPAVQRGISRPWNCQQRDCHHDENSQAFRHLGKFTQAGTRLTATAVDDQATRPHT